MTSFAALDPNAPSAETSEDWQIVFVATTGMEPSPESKDQSADEVAVETCLRNGSDRTRWVWGQDFGSGEPFFWIEAFLRADGGQVWERQRVGMCGSMGREGWLAIEPGQDVCASRAVRRSDIGGEMLLVVRQAYSPNDERGDEVLVGPIVIPAVSARFRISRAQQEGNLLRREHLLEVQQLILRTGQRTTYSAMYNNNPSFRTEGYEFYLDPDTGQRNISCDPELSGFHHLTIRRLALGPNPYRLVDFEDEGAIFVEVPSPEVPLSRREVLDDIEAAIREILDAARE